MKITEIIVHESRGYNHPYENFSNFKQGVTIKAIINEEVEPYHVCVKSLQEKASEEIDIIKNKTLESLNKTSRLEEAKRQIEIELERIRNGNGTPF